MRIPGIRIAQLRYYITSSNVEAILFNKLSKKRGRGE
jgi:hypothetical protein